MAVSGSKNELAHLPQYRNSLPLAKEIPEARAMISAPDAAGDTAQGPLLAFV